MRGLGVFGLVVVIAVAGGYLWLRSWLHSEDFRLMLSQAAGKGLAAQAEFGTFRWDGTTVGSESFDAVGEGLVSELHADGLELNIGLGKVRQGVVEIEGAKVNRLGVVLDLRDEVSGKPLPGETGAAPSDGAKRRRSWYSGLLPSEVRLLDLDVVRSSLELKLDEGRASFSGTGWKVRPEEGGDGYRVEAEGGEIELPWEHVPPIRLDRAKMGYRDLTVFLTDAAFTVYRSGHLDLTGEASLRGGGFAFQGRLWNVEADEVLPEDWKQRLEGVLENDFSVGDSGDGLAVDGSLELRDGVLTALPVLDHLAAYGGNPRFRRLALNDARADYRRKDGTLRVDGIELGSDGLIRLEGSLTVDREDRLDGRFRLGLAPGTLARIPGAETKVFLPGERGLLWTPMRITGTKDDPKEDLSRRLIEAAGERMFELLPETGDRVLKFTRHVAAGDVDSAVDQGREVFRQGEELIDAGKLLLDGDGDRIEQADEVIRQAEGVVRGVGSLLDTIRGREETVPPVEEGEKVPE